MASKKQQDPMSLENLPEYLKSLRESGNAGGSPVVNTGQIVTNTSSTNWFGAVMLALVICMMSIGSVMTYNMMSTKNITVIVDIDNSNPQAISKIVSESGAEVLSVEHKEDSTYAIKVATRKSRSSFLEWLRKNKDVKKVELEE